MGKAHKQKGYRLENTISKKGFLELRKMLGMPQFELAHDNSNIMKIQARSLNIDDDEKWNNSYKPMPEVKIQKYLLHCQNCDQSIISSLNKVDRFLSQQGRLKTIGQSKEEEKQKKQNSLSTEVQYSNKKSLN
ncbi:unnamed protein product [Paramecium octaurelia]|uniref:Uncharacterized protein n=1 Tax=Paramecium octaurelia TaxID=43137 RepID=A0A8S1TSC4_PAROT|nr:unnamed protein product [Paramecium octaurelia]CAD8153869.1 unnamed protein product [Paramecium octaurelia]